MGRRLGNHRRRLQGNVGTALNTPGSISTVGYDQIESVEAGSSDKQVVVNFKSVYGPYKGLFGGLVKAAAVENASDISADFADFIGFSGRPWKMKSWSPSQVVYVPNENYWGADKAVAKQLVMVPLADSDTEAAALKAGEVDFVYPQFYGGIEEAFADPNVTLKKEFGGDYEASTSSRSAARSPTRSSVQRSRSRSTARRSSSRSTCPWAASRRCSVARSSLARTATAMSSPTRTTRPVPRRC